MPDDKPAAPQSLPPYVQLIQMGMAVVSRTVCVTAKLGLADQLASAPKSASELAVPMQVHAPSLHRLMRTLASLGILMEQSEQRFALTSLSVEDRRAGLGKIVPNCYRQSLAAECLGPHGTRFKQANPALTKQMGWHSSTISHTIQRMHRVQRNYGQLSWRGTSSHRRCLRFFDFQDRR